jgi:hypothetical protein
VARIAAASADAADTDSNNLLRPRACLRILAADPRSRRLPGRNQLKRLGLEVSSNPTLVCERRSVLEHQSLLSHHGRSAAATRSLIESEHGRRWAMSLFRTIGER